MLSEEELAELRWHAEQYTRERELINEPELGYDLPRKMLGRLLDEIEELKHENGQLRSKNERLSESCLAMGEELQDLKNKITGLDKLFYEGWDKGWFRWDLLITYPEELKIASILGYKNMNEWLDKSNPRNNLGG